MGMLTQTVRCPKCACSTRVLNTRDGMAGTTKRRRMCSGCAHRFTTWSSADEIEHARPPAGHPDRHRVQVDA